MSIDLKHIGEREHWYRNAERRNSDYYFSKDKKCSKKKETEPDKKAAGKGGMYCEPKATVSICRELKRKRIYDMTNSPYIWGNECMAESQYTANISRTITNNMVKAYTVEVFDGMGRLQFSTLSVCHDVDIVYTNGYILVRDDNGTSIFSLSSKKLRIVDVSDVVYVGRGFFGYKKDDRIYLTLVGNTSFEDGKGVDALDNDVRGLFQTHIGIPYANPTDKPWIIVEFGGKVYAVSADKNDCLDYVNLSDYNIKENGPIVKVGMGSVTKVDDKKSDDVDDERLGNVIADIISKLPDNEHFVKKLCDDDTERNEPIGKYKVYNIDNDTTPKISTQVEETLNLYGKFISQLWQEVYGLPLEY